MSERGGREGGSVGGLQMSYTLIGTRQPLCKRDSCVNLADRISRVWNSQPKSLLDFQKTLKTMADDTDMMAMMGITGFGKQTKKKELDPRRFEKNRREEVGFSP